MDDGKAGKKHRWKKWERIGLVVFLAFMAAMLFAPTQVAELFDAMTQKCLDTVVKNWIIGATGVATLVAVMTGRILERLGLTDALIRIFRPIAKLLNINPTFLIAGVYNFLGDANAAGKISAPIMQKAGATEDEIKIAVATMFQFPPTFASFMLGISCLAVAGINAFLALIFSVFLPLILVPLLLRFTVYRNCKYKDVSEVPTFTPTTGALDTVFGGAVEGAQVLFLTIIPIACAMFSIIAALEYIQIWPFIQNALYGLCQLCCIEPECGVVSMVVAATVGFPMLSDMIQSGMVIAPGVVLATFMLGTSSFPLTLPLANLPRLWSQATGISQGKLLVACLIGMVCRFVSCAIVGYVVAPLIF
ncbi:hypothetical protein [Flavonifractor sp. An91]|uniref:hypothetical protein n=1 Tax=Flavonifractor sp. An91 TaxID=1965665 RepID=UPI000B38FC72|nr:hypothetical protein [Flavonifractor sp. An91]OUN10862.1 hypothetical protein B5G42_09455 [Flavonifractor sp. An91]